MTIYMKDGDEQAMDHILKVESLTKLYKGFAIEDVSFELEKGCIMGFIGQNGAGKTSTLKLLLNAIGRDSGKITIFSKDNIEDEVYIKSRLGYVPDESYFLYNSTLKGHAKAMKPFYEKWSDEILGKYINLFEIAPDQRVQDMSKGMKTKAMLALALAHQPELLILDEPTAGLDPVARIEVLDILREFVSDGEKSVLFSTHITSDLDKVADYITIINKGRILESLSIDLIEEKYVMLAGPVEEISGKEKEFIGVRKGAGSFEGLILRKRADILFKNYKKHTPNIENLLTFTIWGNRT